MAMKQKQLTSFESIVDIESVWSFSGACGTRKGPGQVCWEGGNTLLRRRMRRVSEAAAPRGLILLERMHS